MFPCDVASDEQIDGAVRRRCGKRWDGLDGLVHAIGFAPREAIAGDLLDGLSREAFRIAHDISAYSFPALAKAALPMMEGRARRAAHAHLPRRGARDSALQHHGPRQGEPGGERALPRAQTSGRRASASTRISAGPIKTLAAAGIAGFGKILKYVENIRAAAAQRHHRRSRQRRGVPAVRPRRRASPAEILYVDGGFNVVSVTIADDAERT